MNVILRMTLTLDFKESEGGSLAFEAIQRGQHCAESSSDLNRVIARDACEGDWGTQFDDRTWGWLVMHPSRHVPCTHVNDRYGGTRERAKYPTGT